MPRCHLWCKAWRQPFTPESPFMPNITPRTGNARTARNANPAGPAKPASRKPPGAVSSPFELGMLIQRQQQESAGTGCTMQAVPAGQAVQGCGCGKSLQPIGATGKSAPFDPMAPLIVKGRRLPPIVRAAFGAQGRALQLLARMQPGDSVDINASQAHRVAACAKKHGIRVALRQLGPDLYGVWRLPGDAQKGM